MAKGHQECVPKSLPDGVVELCQNGKYIQKDERQQKRNTSKEIYKYTENAAVLCKDNAEVQEEHGCQCQQDQPDDGRLPEILPERFKETGKYVGLVVLGHFHGHIIAGGQRGADGDDGNAAEEYQKIQNDDICYFGSDRIEFS